METPSPHKRLAQRATHFAATLALSMATFQLGTALPDAAKIPSETASEMSQLVLNVTGYDTQNGKILVALYNDARAFDEEASPFRDTKVKVNGAETVVIFENIPSGEYAFKLYHDENGNNELDLNGLGIPSEDYAFSRDASDPFSAPEWGESKFSLPVGKTVQDISLGE
jgi:uncharacterized protein (DUF2141 family)